MSAIECVNEGHAENAGDIREYMSGNLCRCAAYPNIVAAVEQAQFEMKGRQMQAFTYLRPQMSAEAVRLGSANLARAATTHIDGSNYISSGTNLAEYMRLGSEPLCAYATNNSRAAHGSETTSIARSEIPLR